MSKLKALGPLEQQSLSSVLDAALEDGGVTSPESRQKSMASIIALITTLPGLISALLKFVPQIQQLIQQLIDAFKKMPIPGPAPDGGTVPPKPI